MAPITRKRRENRPFLYSPWWSIILQEVRRRSHCMCEVDGCLHSAEHFHHVNYPVGRRESPLDLLHLCEWHHLIAHCPQAANDNFDLDQYELELEESA